MGFSATATKTSINNEVSAKIDRDVIAMLSFLHGKHGGGVGEARKDG